MSQNKTNINRTEVVEQSGSAREPLRNGTEPEPESSLAVTAADLPISSSHLRADIKGKKFKSLKEHRNKLKPSSKDISESDYNNN